MSNSGIISEVNAFAAELDLVWQEHKTQRFSKGSVFTLLDSYFDQAQKPFVSFLDLIECLFVAPVKSREKLIECTWKQFSSWLEATRFESNKSSDNIGTTPLFNCEILHRAARVSLKDNMKYFPAACNLFRFTDHCPRDVIEIFSEKLGNLVDKKDYRGIASIFDHLGTKLLSPSNLDDETMRHLALFLISKRESPLLRKILLSLEPKERVYTLVSFLDSIIETETHNLPVERGDLCKSAYGTRAEFMHSPTCTIVTTLIEDLNIPPKLCPNVTFIHLKELTDFMIGATFGPYAEMDITTFHELVEKFSKGDERYSQFVVDNLIRLGYHDEARFCSEMLKIGDDYLSSAFAKLSLEKRECIAAVPQICDNNAEKFPFYTFPLKEDAIIFVKNVEEYRSALKQLLFMSTASDDQQKAVGVDSEWPAVLPPGCKATVSILQLALLDRVYIIDIDNLSPIFTDEDWLLFRNLFTSSEVKKITFGFESDQEALAESFPKVFKDVHVSNVVDLERLTEQIWKTLRALGRGPILVNNKTLSLDAVSSPMPSNLSDVAKTFIGRRFRKMFRLSNWSRRPLERGQLLYAAIDAYCLFEIYREMRSVIISQKLDISSEVTGCLPKLQPYDIHLRCDALLTDLGYYLKQLGFNVIIEDSSCTIDQLITKALSHEKIITATHLAPKLDSKNQVIAVPLGTLESQAEFIAIRLNVQVDFKDAKSEPVFHNPIQHLHQITAHLPDRGHVAYEDVVNDSHPNEPPFMTICRLTSVATGQILLEMRGVGATKHEAKNRAATNMIIKLTTT